MSNLKRIFALLCILTVSITCLSFDSVFAAEKSARNYELWTQSPNITSGITNDELRIYKAMDKNEFELYPLKQLGANYYLGICEGKVTDGGYNGNKDLSDLYYYVLLMTDDDFIILSKGVTYNGYYWDRGNNIVDISSQINSSYYTSNGYEVPCYIINPNGKYTNSNYTEYDEYYFITKNGNLFQTSENADYALAGYPFIYNGVLYRGCERYSSGSRNYYYYMQDGSTQATLYQPYLYRNGTLSYGASDRVPAASVTTGNGYTVYKEGFSSNINISSYYKIPDTDNMYMNISQPYTYDSSASRYYYYQKIDIYKCNNGIMTLYKTKTIPTNYTYMSAVSVKNLIDIDDSSYTSKGYSTPKMAIGNNIIILQDGTICNISLDSKIYKNWNLAAYNNKLVVIRNQDGDSALYWRDENNSSYYWQKLNYIYFDVNGDMIKENDITLKIIYAPNPGQNGYYYNYSTFNQPSFTSASVAPTKSWFGRCPDNVFPDGRYVNAVWMGIGSGMYEMWYNIYKSDGTLMTTGPTGYSTYFGSSFDTYDLITFAVNNSKFIVSLNMVTRDWAKEYYRVAVVQESDTGEITGNGTIGEKYITPPNETDTEIAQSKIDFSKDDLPIGYNIKNNVIDSGKLDSSLRQQMNTIRLNDIVLLKKTGYISGNQNTGSTLATYSTYDYGLGSSYVRFYSNGQNFNWYCYNPESLTAGTYNKTFYVGDKTIYVNIKVITPPSNNGVTKVTF